MKRLKKNTIVKWRNRARGHNKLMRGTVLAFVPAGASPALVLPKKHQTFRYWSAAKESIRDRYAVDVRGETYLPTAKTIEAANA